MITLNDILKNVAFDQDGELVLPRPWDADKFVTEREIEQL